MQYNMEKHDWNKYINRTCDTCIYNQNPIGEFECSGCIDISGEINVFNNWTPIVFLCYS